MTAAEYAAQHNLPRVGARPALGSYLKQAWERRDFAFELARARLQSGNQRNRLGMLWVVIQPTMNALMYGFIFGVLQTTKPADFPVYVVIGVFLFEFFSASVGQGAKAITGNGSLVQSLAFPRITLPFASVLQQFLGLMPVLGVMFVFCWILGTTPKPSWLLIVPLLAIYSIFNFGIALICARLTVHLRDFTQIIPIIIRVLFFTSGVLFGIERVTKAFPAAEPLFAFHPIYQTLQIARGVIMDGAVYSSSAWLVVSAWAFALLIFGVFFFWSAEEQYGRVN